MRGLKHSALFLSSLMALSVPSFAQEQPLIEPRIVFVADKHDRTAEVASWMVSKSQYFKRGGFNLLALECSEKELPFVSGKVSQIHSEVSFLRVNILALADIARIFKPFSKVECFDTPAVVITAESLMVAKALYERELEMASKILSALERANKVVVVAGALHAFDGYIVVLSGRESFSFPSLHSLLLSYGLSPTAVAVFDPLGLTEHFKTFPAITTEEPMNDE